MGEFENYIDKSELARYEILRRGAEVLSQQKAEQAIIDKTSPEKLKDVQHLPGWAGTQAPVWGEGSH